MVSGIRSTKSNCRICHNLANTSDWQLRRQLQERAAMTHVELFRALYARGFSLRRLHVFTYYWSAAETSSTDDVPRMGEELRSMYSLPGNMAEASLTVIHERNRSRSALLGEAMHAIRHDVLASDAVLATRFDLEFKNVSATALKVGCEVGLCGVSVP